MTVDQIIETTIGKEGSYSNHPADRGGETMWGITVAVARANGYAGPMRALPRATAKSIYWRQYYDRPGFAAVGEISPRIAEKLFDIGVNMGTDFPRRWLQEWLNALNQQGRDYGDIIEDGQIGPGTLGALRGLIAKRGRVSAESAILKGLNGDQTVRYKQIARARAANEAFLYGWLANRVGMVA